MNFNPSQDVKINQTYNRPPKKNKKKTIILVIFFIIMLVVTYAVYSYYVKTTKKDVLSSEFFEKIVNNDLAFFIENELYEKVGKKVEDQNYNSVSNIKLSTTMENNMFSELDLSRFEFVYDYTKAENQSYSKVVTRYSDRDVITLQGIRDKEMFAIKSDEIVNKFVGINTSNTQEVLEKILDTDVDLTSAKLIKNFLFDREHINIGNVLNGEGLKDYAQILKDNTSFENFSKKENVVVTLNQEQVTTTEYTLELSSNQVSQIFNEISEKLENDNKLLSEFVVSDVVEFENEDTGIIDYTDNDNTIEVSGEENNFNASINIWGQNTTDENTVTNEISTENNTVGNNSAINNDVVNNAVNHNATVNNTVANNTVAENATNETNNTVVNQQLVQETINSVQEENVVEEPVGQEVVEESAQNQAEIEQTENVANETTNTVVEEEENLRIQGYIEVNESVQVDDEEPFVIGKNYEETIKNIVELSENIDWKTYILTGAKVNYTQEELVTVLQEIILNSLEANSGLIIKIYVSENETVKWNFEFPEAEQSFDIEIISVSDNEKYLNLKLLNGKEDNSNGYTISLYKKENDAGVKSKININKIYKSKISQKISLNLDTKGTVNSKKYVTNIDILYSDSDGEFNAQIEDSLNFDIIPEIEELNNENCLFLDEISDEELLLTRDAIAQKTREVLHEKNSNLNIVDTNNSVVEQITQNQQTEDETHKEEVKQVLIKTLSDKMREYLDSGKQLKIQDLKELEIPGYEVNISISSNLAIITVNGYNFKLDSDFNLSDS